MRLPLHRSESDCFKLIYENILAGEETQELVVPDVCEDVAKILDVRGQVLLCGKRAAGDKINLSCMVEVTVIYAPEGGGAPKSMSAAIPLELNGSFDGANEGVLISARLELCGLDARLLNSRKLLLRAHLQAFVCCYMRDSFVLWDSLPSDSTQKVEILKKELHHNLIKDVCEKSFVVSDEFPLTERAADSRLISAATELCVGEAKAVGNKIVFKAIAKTEALFLGEEGNLFSYCFETPFSQIIETECAAENSELQIVMQLKSCEFVMLPNREVSAISASFQICAQALCCEHINSCYIADAYSNQCEISPEFTEVMASRVISRKTMHLKLSSRLPNGVNCSDICYIAPVELCTEIKGNVIHYCLTTRGTYQAENEEHCALEIKMTANEEMILGKTQAMRIISVCFGEHTTHENSEVCIELSTELEVFEKLCARAACALDFSDECINKCDCPSLVVLCNSSKHDLWGLAKKYGSTMDIIETVNCCGEGFDVNMRPLLIPKA